MKRSRFLYAALVAIGAIALLTAPGPSQAQSMLLKLENNDVAGFVRSSNGPEAGVWVIATTNDLPTKYAKIVVTDDRGRYLIPDLPSATYSVWARGYGLLDSAPVKTRPGHIVDLRPHVAPNAAAAAQYYPAQYWFAMIDMPGKSEFPGTGANGNGINPNIKSLGQWMDLVKTDGCVTCHQLGEKATRTIPSNLAVTTSSLAQFSSTSTAAWARRVESGQAGGLMARTIGEMGTRSLRMFSAWTDSVSRGALPFAKPQRPQGIERNVVITEWDWATPTTYLHDEISTDKRDPRLNAYGKLYGSTEESTDFIPVLDPVRNVASFLRLQVIDPKTAYNGGTALAKPLQPSPYYGDLRTWASQTISHNPMFDEEGRVWFTARIRPDPNPAFCKDGSIPSSKIVPLAESGRQAEMYDPKTGKYVFANLCFNTHHLVFAHDADDTLWFSAGGPRGNVVGWLNTKVLLQTGDSAKAQGWTPFIVDTVGTGKRTAEFNDIGKPVDPKKDTRIGGGFYGLAVSPADGTVWGSVLGYPGEIIHVIPGPNPPETALSEVFALPADRGYYSPRGLDIDRNGVVWIPLASGSLASFDRRKCRGPVSGPNAASGKLCPEGWAFYPFPGPQFKGVSAPGSAEAAYYVWIDQYNTFGLGDNVPIVTGNESDAALALVHGKFETFTIPYPLGFYAKNFDGRIDDPSKGWKGRGLWTTFGSRAPFHMETGKGQRPIVYHLQLRPNPLAD